MKNSPLKQRKTNNCQPALAVGEILPPSTSFKKSVNVNQLPAWQTWALIAALLLYLVVRFIGLDTYPIYFFTDEAVQTVLAADLVRDNFRDYQDELLPTFFKNGGQYNLGTSVYLQVIPWLIFGKSIWVTRGVSVLLSLFAALSVGLILKKNYQSGYAFAGILLLSCVPAWFLHSRTAFEAVIAVSFYAGFLFCYQQYLCGKTRWFFAAVILGGLCFYSYSPAQMVILVTAVSFMISDFKFHLRNWKTFLIGLVIAILVAIPYFRFLALHPEENLRHLEILNSYWIQDISLMEKFRIYGQEYFRALNPLYWFIPNEIDLERHLMKNFGHMLIWTLPLFLLGLVIAMRHVRESKFRILILSLLCAPTGSALAGAAVTRALFWVIPAILMVTLGLNQTLTWIEKIGVSKKWLIRITFASLVAVNGFLLRDALINGPTWYSNYSLGGLQFGAKQVFGEIQHLVNQDPERKIFLTPSWANGTDVLARYFFDDPLPFEMGSIDAYLYSKLDFSANQIFILTPDEMDEVNHSGKFKTLKLIKIIQYPNHEPGFYFIQLEYSDDIDQLLAEERAERQKLIEKDVTDPLGRALTIQHSSLDMGEIQNLFDDNIDSLVRSAEINPLKLEITSARPLEIKQIALLIGGAPTTILITINPENGSAPITLTQSLPEDHIIREINFNLEKPVQTNFVRISVTNTNDSDRAHVHLWEVTLK